MIFKSKGKNYEFNVDTKRIDRNAKNAQKKLNMQIVADSTPLVPFQQGGLRGQVDYPKGLSGDEIRWYAPYAHYQYMGDLYTDEAGRTFVGKNEQKPVNTGIPLNYHESGTGDHWFDKAKEDNLRKWIGIVQRELQKG